MSSVMSSRCREPLAMLETSREWMGLTCDINNLERMKSVGEIRRVKPHEDGGHLTNRRSAPEVTSPRLVRVQVSSSDTIQNWRNEDWNRNSWKPRTDFERSYFSVDKTSARSADGRWYHSSENCDGLAIERNGESRGLQGGSVAHTFSPSFHDSEDGSASVFPRDKPDILFQAGSNEFHGSRERIHEIFEHNRLLRRRFFADMPADDVPKQFPNDAKGSDQISLMKSPSSSSSVVKQTNSRFGSTETLTSQSNQSGASSNDPKFDHSPELFVFDCNKESLETVSFIDSKADPHELSVVRNANASPIESVSFEYRHLPCQAFARHSNYTDNRFDAAAEHAGDSGLSSIPRLDYEHCPSTEPKLFAAQVKILDLPEADGPSLRKLRNYRPASLDLSGVNKRSQIHEGIRRMMRNYTADVTPFLTDQQDSKNSYDVALRGTKSLLELSTPSSGAVGKKIHANKSCSDLTITQDLRSPQLVNSLTNSLMDLNVGHEGDGKLNGLSGSGTTLPLIYGPIPYS